MGYSVIEWRSLCDGNEKKTIYIFGMIRKQPEKEGLAFA